jgi:hypothetical protein
MRCLKGCTIKDDDQDAITLESGEVLCGFHVDDLLGKAPTPSLDSIGRVITLRKQPKRRAAFSNSLGAFAPRLREKQ